MTHAMVGGVITSMNGLPSPSSPPPPSIILYQVTAVATSQNFGILGNGRLHVIELSPAPLGPGVPRQPITELVSYDTADGVYDVA
ncbi:hypothetical protein ACFX13_037163 [Malus domestica]